MKNVLLSPKFISITLALIALVIIPLTLIEIQSQQSLKQNAETILWTTNQSASATCDEGEVFITVTFTNTESRSSSTAMNVVAKDQQTGKSVNMGSIVGGATVTKSIDTVKQSLNAGSVTFSLTWTDGHSGTDSRTASYKAISSCNPTPTAPVTPSPTVPPGQPTPTICPTLSPVKNVHIVCPNCQK